MKVIRFHEIGPPEVLRIEEAERPEPSSGEVLVKIEFCGVNFADVLTRRGDPVFCPTLPATPGFEAAGVIAAVGDEVREHDVGERVALMGSQLYAEYAVATCDQLLPLPDDVSTKTGAAFPTQALTAYHLLHTAHNLQSGQTVLVHAAAGGLGLLAVQMAKLAGARVFGTVSTQEKAIRVRELGADAVINYREDDFVAVVQELTDGCGVDLVLDSVGRDTFLKSIAALGPYGNVVTFGRASGELDSFDPDLLVRNAQRVTGFTLRFVREDVSLLRKSAGTIYDWLRTKRLRLTIDSDFPLADASKAHAHLEGRGSIGKILLRT